MIATTWPSPLKMGEPLVPGVPLTVGELQVIPFSGDHVSVNCADEWDALPYLVRDRGNAGSFFSMVDVALVPAHVQWAKAFAARPGLVTWSNNALDWSHMAHYLAERVEGSPGELRRAR